METSNLEKIMFLTASYQKERKEILNIFLQILENISQKKHRIIV